tara:strand:- start:1620 stop:2654 length:1035 start_codon:yes stop_codon:yes gene_type:complete
MPIDIHLLKRQLFNNSDDYMGQLQHRGFECSEPSHMKRFGSLIKFYDEKNRVYSLNTPPSSVKSIAIIEGKYYLSIDCDWNIEEQIKKCAEIAHLEIAELNDISFDLFWQHCSIPKDVKLSEYTKSKNKKANKYIRLYNEGKEITGYVQITNDSNVCANIRPILSVTEYEKDKYQFGFKFLMGAGMKLVQLGGNPPQIRRPWNWDTVDFNTLSIPLYNSLGVKTPSMSVVGVQNSTIKVTTNQDFEKAMNEFHGKAGVTDWDHSIEITGRHKVTLGSTAIASIEPYKDNKTIRWKTLSIHSSRPKKQTGLQAPPRVGDKRGTDTSDNPSGGHELFGVQTKRQCT